LETKEPVSAAPVLTPEPEPEKEVVAVKPVEPPPPVTVDAKPEPREGLFSGLFRSRDREEVPPAPEPVKPQREEEEVFSDTPELAALLRPTPAETKPAEPALTVVEVLPDVEEEENEADTLILDLDKELANTAAGDLVDNQPGDTKDDQKPAASEVEEDDAPRQS
jgi:hypothetical protein